MMYNFKVIETYSKNVEIEAESKDKAFDLVRKKYEAGEIKFDPADDFAEYEIYLKLRYPIKFVKSNFGS